MKICLVLRKDKGYKLETMSFMCQKDEVRANGKEDRNCVKTLLPSIIILEVFFFSSEAAVSKEYAAHRVSNC